jgi:hypothetical protein
LENNDNLLKRLSNIIWKKIKNKINIRIEMGCIYTKKEGFEKKKGGELPSINDEDIKKNNCLNRIDTCSTIATNSARVMKSKFVRRLFLMDRYKNTKTMQKKFMFKE